MSGTPVSTTGHHKPGFTEIRVKGHMDKRWINWFDGLSLTVEDNGHTRLTGHGVNCQSLTRITLVYHYHSHRETNR